MRPGDAAGGARGVSGMWGNCVEAEVILWDEGRDCCACTWDRNDGRAVRSQDRAGSAQNKAARWALLLGRRPPAGGKRAEVTAQEPCLGLQWARWQRLGHFSASGTPRCHSLRLYLSHCESLGSGTGVMAGSEERLCSALALPLCSFCTVCTGEGRPGAHRSPGCAHATLALLLAPFVPKLYIESPEALIRCSDRPCRCFTFGHVSSRNLTHHLPSTQLFPCHTNGETEAQRRPGCEDPSPMAAIPAAPGLGAQGTRCLCAVPIKVSMSPDTGLNAVPAQPQPQPTALG